MILITGGTGLLGTVVARQLAEQGHKSVLLDIAPNIQQLEELRDYKSYYEVVRGDIMQLPDLLLTLKKYNIDTIIHAAAMLTPGATQRPYAGVTLNINGTLNVVEAARLEKVKRVIFCSSATVYNYGIKSTAAVTEAHPIGPKSVYGTTKIAGEYIGLNYQQFYGLEFAAFRFAQLYGPGYTQSGSAGLWLDPLLKQMAKGEDADLVRPSRQVSEYIYVEDASQALVKAALTDRIRNSIYNISEGKLTWFDQLIGILRDAYPNQQINIKDPVEQEPYDERSHPYDLSLLREDLGFEVNYPIEKALPHYVDWLKRNLYQN